MAQRSPIHDVTAAAGAVFAEEARWLMPDHFAGDEAEYQQARAQAALFDRSHHGKIQVSGADAVTFLHNLCTNDIKALKPGAGCESFLTTAKAKIVAHVLLFRSVEDEPRLWIDAGPGLGEVVLKHLDRHLISEQVEVLDATHDLAQLHLTGPQAGAVFGKALGTIVPELSELQIQANANGPLILRKNSVLGLPGYDIVCLLSDAGRIWSALIAAGAAAAGRAVYDMLRVEAGWPVYGPDMDEERFVVEVGRTRQAICYTKGCYLGQEPIVMARDRGHVNRTLRGLRIEGSRGVPAGAQVLRDGAEAGTITTAVVSPRLGVIALAYLRRGNWDPGTVVQVTAGGEQRSASVAGLPFDGAGAGGS
jgi:folate-binding protein YgfZ